MPTLGGQVRQSAWKLCENYSATSESGFDDRCQLSCRLSFSRKRIKNHSMIVGSTCSAQFLVSAYTLKFSSFCVVHSRFPFMKFFFHLFRKNVWEKRLKWNQKISIISAWNENEKILKAISRWNRSTWGIIKVMVQWKHSGLEDRSWFSERWLVYDSEFHPKRYNPTSSSMAIIGETSNERVWFVVG